MISPQLGARPVDMIRMTGDCPFPHPDDPTLEEPETYALRFGPLTLLIRTWRTTAEASWHLAGRSWSVDLARC